MSDAAAAMHAAKEAQADTLQPQLYQRAVEIFGNAKREYRNKNFKEADAAANQARHLAEQAEFESIKITSSGGGSDQTPPDTMSAPAAAQPGPPPDQNLPPNDYAQPQQRLSNAGDFPPDQPTASPAPAASSAPPAQPPAPTLPPGTFIQVPGGPSGTVTPTPWPPSSYFRSLPSPTGRSIMDRSMGES